MRNCSLIYKLKELIFNKIQKIYSNSRSAAANRSISFVLCAADKEIRNLAEFFGTVGGRIAGIKIPLSCNAFLICMTSLFPPIITGCIGVSEGNKFQRSNCSSFFK